jgi:hypothetical protein
MRLILTITFAFSLVFFAGCAGDGSGNIYDKEITTPTSATVQGATIPEAMERSRERLSSMGFRLDKFDTDQGYLRTKPLGAGQFWQLWRGDNVGAANAAMANVNSIARVVEMEFEQGDQGVAARCRVQVKKLSYVGRDITGVADMNEAFTDTSGGIQTLSLEHSRPQWLDLGRDVRLEEKLLLGIAAK